MDGQAAMQLCAANRGSPAGFRARSCTSFSALPAHPSTAAPHEVSPDWLHPVRHVWRGAGRLVHSFAGIGGSPTQHDPEVLAICGEQRGIFGQPLLSLGPATSPEQGRATDRDAALSGEPSADGPLGEVRGWPGLLIPAGRDEIVKHLLLRLDPVLGLAIPQEHRPRLRRGGTRLPDRLAGPLLTAGRKDLVKNRHDSDHVCGDRDDQRDGREQSQY